MFSLSCYRLCIYSLYLLINQWDVSTLFSWTVRTYRILVAFPTLPSSALIPKAFFRQKKPAIVLSSSPLNSYLHRQAWKELFFRADGWLLFGVRWRERWRLDCPWFWSHGSSVFNRYTKQRRPCRSTPSGLWSLWEAEAWRKDVVLVWWCCALDRFAWE